MWTEVSKAVSYSSEQVVIISVMVMAMQVLALCYVLSIWSSVLRISICTLSATIDSLINNGISGRRRIVMRRIFSDYL